MTAAVAPDVRRVRARIAGTVQGVGFRPYVYRLALELGLSGFVLNDPDGVLVEVEANAAVVERFFDRLPAESPPLARIDRVQAEPVPTTGGSEFTIRESAHAGAPHADVTPDSATCDDCLRELFDPADRRFRYPFVNCTNCGPRFTIVRGVPYDRPLTTMAGFEMCPACRAEYTDPANRRFHAQPNACPECGPSLRLLDVAGGEVAHALATASHALSAGQIVAVKGIGGFHLACRADDEEAVARLRARKHREDKPFALMVGSLEQARQLVEATAADEAQLSALSRPIVLIPRRDGARIATAVAPHARELGLMLPYSPLHHLLLTDVGVPVVMTSGNVSDEPIAFRDEDALERLAGLADLFLMHDRPIETRTDDSIVRTVEVGEKRRPMILRRSRGYVPAAIRLPLASPLPILACGGELKNTFCLVDEDRAWVGHHIGDLENWETLTSFQDGIEHFKELFAVEPSVVAHDLHPEYLSTKYALERDGVERVAVQHHHAHLAACLAEHCETGPAVAAIYDGTGLGSDGTIWGGELLWGDTGSFERAGSLWPVRLPGGGAAVREPWRMAYSWLEAAGVGVERAPSQAERTVVRMIQTGVGAPETTSAGRLFDAISALCGICTHVNYEGQAAVELEAACDPDEMRGYPMPLVQHHGRLVLDARQTVRAVRDDLASGEGVAAVAARFHNGLADATASACLVLARRHRCATVVLSGGSFQNRRLLERTSAQLAGAGMRVLIPERLPPGDGGLSYGQAAVAATLLRAREEGRLVRA